MSEDDVQDASTDHNPQDGKPNDLKNKKTMEEIITLARKLAALHIPHSIREALRDEVKFRIDSAAQIVGIASD